MREDPSAIYRASREANETQAAEHRRLDHRISNARLAVFAAGVALVWPTVVSRAISGLWLLLPVVAFIVLLVLHDRVVRRRTRAERAAAYYRRGLARLEDAWVGEGPDGNQFQDAQHPYAADLDVFGRGSLFQLLCTARTRGGMRTLADWLREPAAPAEIRRRQQAVDELRHRLDLREDLALLGESLDPEIHAEEIVSWVTAPPVLTARWPHLVAPALALLNVGTLGLWMRTQYGPVAAVEPSNWLWGSVPFWSCVLISSVVGLLLRTRTRRVLGRLDRPQRELRLLSMILRRLERERFRSPLLTELRSALDSGERSPSRRIAGLARLARVNDSRLNMIFAPISALLLLGTQLALAVERWRSASGLAVPSWIEAVGAIEALCALSGFAYEHPEDPFPEIVEDGPVFDGEGIGHPLLGESVAVRNDLILGNGLQLLLVSGSNMSGKSTLLRTVGVNAVLSLAGATVRARRLRLSPLTLGACMRVHDSLQEGLSHFYAEIKRLRRIVDLGQGALPLLFLLDEILHGTNSHDRHVGAAALIRSLLDDDAVGLVTTHDLALARIADELGPRALNVHFEDRLDDGRIVFDYLLRPGVVAKGNALGLMRAVGLKV
jgi:hypothetical protein